jgi:putative ABC transport system permease protein
MAGKSTEIIKIAFSSIRAQLLRTVITGLIIAIGIMALVGILTAIDAIEGGLRGQFALLGANTFTIRNTGPNIQIGRNGKRPKVHPPIPYHQAVEFKENFESTSALVSISYIASGAAEVKYKNQHTDPNIQIWAVDENFLQTSGYSLAQGRGFSTNELKDAASVAIIGQDVKEKLFGKENPIGQVIQVRNARFRIIGLTGEKGNSFGSGGDKAVFIPITKARNTYGNMSGTFALNVMAINGAAIDDAVGEATMTMRAVRRLKPKQKTNFHITKSDNLSQKLIENLSFLKIAAMLIGGITLFGAAIALMNIMLVSVTERTREIGIRKSIGAKAGFIMLQFLSEALLICILGGVVGIILGIGIGSLVSLIGGGVFHIPWAIMGIAMLLCLVVGILSGFYPSYKAARLNPIDALRYE